MNPEQEAMEIMMLFGKGGHVMDSGGKDSTVLKEIAWKCHEKYGLQYDIVHNHTTIDAPETVYFVRRERERERGRGIEYTISYPEMSFDQLCLKKGMLPTRIKRFCCNYLKEKTQIDEGRLVSTITGVRRNESTARKKNQGAVTMIGAEELKDGVIDGVNFTKTDKGGVVLLNYDNSENVEMVYTCFRTNKRLVNPLINWTDDDVWRYIRDNKLPYNPLYECGWNRVGCVGCPMAGNSGRTQQFARYPKYKERYIRIADRIVEKQKAKKGDEYNGAPTGLLYFKRWMEDDNVVGQFSFDMDGNITEDYT